MSFSGRKDCTSGEAKCKPEGERGEREALYCVGTHSKKTRTVIAEEMGISASTLGAWIDPHGDERMPDERRDQMLKIARDNDAWLKFHAQRLGFVVYDPKQATGKGLSRMVSEFSDVLRVHDEATADGKWEVDEALRFEREIQDLHATADAEVRKARIAAGIDEVAS